MTHSYYSERPSARRLERCYELKPPAVQRYLAAEIEHVRHRLPRGGRVLELGCGYVGGTPLSSQLVPGRSVGPPEGSGSGRFLHSGSVRPWT